MDQSRNPHPTLRYFYTKDQSDADYLIHYCLLKPSTQTLSLQSQTKSSVVNSALSSLSLLTEYSRSSFSADLISLAFARSNILIFVVVLGRLRIAVAAGIL